MSFDFDFIFCLRYKKEHKKKTTMIDSQQTLDTQPTVTSFSLCQLNFTHTLSGENVNAISIQSFQQQLLNNHYDNVDCALKWSIKTVRIGQNSNFFVNQRMHDCGAIQFHRVNKCSAFQWI